MAAITFVSDSTTAPTTRPLFSFFDDPHFWYNFVNFFLATFGAAIGLWALFLAYDQLAKTLKAARAAQDAAEKTKNAIRGIKSVMDSVQLIGLCAEVLHLMRDRHLRSAGLRLRDLLSGVVGVKSSASGAELNSEEGWQSMLTQIASVHDIVNKAISENSQLSDFQVMRCVELISKVETDLQIVKVTAAGNLGA
jgi:hypothetical protein